MWRMNNNCLNFGKDLDLILHTIGKLSDMTNTEKPFNCFYVIISEDCLSL